MKSILVPIDFSENSDKAIAAAKIIAETDGAQLTFLHAYQPYVADVSLPLTSSSLPVYQELEKSYQARLDAYVDLALEEGFKADSVWAQGDLDDAIHSYAKAHATDLIVVGRTGRGGFLDKLIGSAATKIAMDAPCPVLIIPPQTTDLEFRKIVYATQLEYEEIDNLRQVVALASQFGAKLTFIKVSSLEQPNIQDDNQYIDQITAELGISADDIIIHTGGGVMEEIEKHCDEVKADLLVVSTRDRDFFERFIINPSVTRKLIVETHIPLLVHHIK